MGGGGWGSKGITTGRTSIASEIWKTELRETLYTLNFTATALWANRLLSGG